MRDIGEFITKGRVIRVDGQTVVFAPAGTSYELYLKTPQGDYTGPVNALVKGVIRGQARKVYTVPSGGNFTQPIQGPPRIVQGWVLDGDDQTLVVQAGATYIVTLPSLDSAIDLDEGPLAVNRMVNVTLFPGASFEPVGSASAVTA